MEIGSIRPAATRASFFGCSTGWWYLDRSGALRELPIQKWTAASFVPPLSLDATQEQRMIDASEPDAVLHLLAQHDAQSLDRIKAGERHDFVKRCLDQARRWGLETPDDQMLYCMVALELGPTFEEQQHWTAALERVREGTLRWSDALQGVLSE